MLLTFSHRNIQNSFRRMTLLISYSSTGTRIKMELQWLDASSTTGLQWFSYTKMFHEQIASRNKATRWTVCTLARIVAGISPATMYCQGCCQFLYNWILHSRFQRSNYQKYYFTISKLFKHCTSWSCILYAMVHRSVLQWTRWEGTVVAVHFSNDEIAS